VREYDEKVFIPQWYCFQPRQVCFDESGAWWIPDTLPQGEKPQVLVTHDESTFNINDSKRQRWVVNGKSPLRPKSKGKGIVVSLLLTPSGVLQVRTTVPDTELLKDLMRPMLDGKPVREAMQYLQYGKDNYWTRDKMADQATQVAAKIFPYAFPCCQALFAFDNASNRSCCSHNAVVRSRMNLNPESKQLLTHESFAHCLN
jgi:hypothetical protein